MNGAQQRLAFANRQSLYALVGHAFAAAGAAVAVFLTMCLRSGSCVWLNSIGVGRGVREAFAPKIREKYFSGKYDVKLWHFVNFFSYIYFSGRQNILPLPPPTPKLTELLRLCLIPVS